jgi:hypothetical protein
LDENEEKNKAGATSAGATDTEEQKDDPESTEDVESASPEETKPRSLNFDHYLGGAGIAWGLGNLLLLTVSWGFQYAGVEMTIPLILAINILPPMVGGMVATFLFTRVSRVNYMVDGVKIGIGGFFLTFLYTSILGQGVGGAYILTGFLLGGVFGGFITKQIYE